jgi:hypothetical protein
MAHYRHKHSSKYPKTMSLSYSCMKHLGNHHVYVDRFKHATVVKLRAAREAIKELQA